MKSSARSRVRIASSRCRRRLRRFSWPVVFRRQLQIDPRHALVWHLVFDLQIGHGNAAVNDPQTVPLGNVALLVWVIPFWAEPSKIAIHFLFQFEVEEHAAHLAA